MAKVHSSRAKIYEAKSTVADEPTQHVESEGERLIKQMVQKQMDTQITLQQHLKQNKEFKSATEFVPLTKYTSGQTSLKEFEDSAKKASYIEELKSFGLSKEEVELLLDYEEGEDVFADKHKKMEKSILSSHLLLIHKKIEQGKKEWEGAVEERFPSKVSRHECELGLSVKPDSEHTKLLQFAMSCRPKAVDERPADHPIHRLKDMEQDLFGHLTTKPRKRLKRKRQPQTLTPSEFSERGLGESSSLWDVREERTSLPLRREVLYTYTCKPEFLYTVKNKKVVPFKKSEGPNTTIEDKQFPAGQAFVVSDMTNVDIRTISSKDIQNNRLSSDQIKELPRFQDYTPGYPAQVLYLKNLAGSVKEDDLISLFGQFEEPDQQRIVYRLMSGKMRGQAFITFPSIERATVALESINGFILKGKPIIIQYGRASAT